MHNISEKIKAILLARRQRLVKAGTGGSGKFPFKKVMLWALIGFIGLIIASVIFFAIFIAVLSIGLPDVRDIDKLSVAQSTTIYDREGNILYVKHGDENRKYVPYDQISKHLVDATVSIEDSEFWTHKGFDIPGIVAAVMHEVFGIGGARGGSTITQQYVKNAFLTNERSYTRKLKELILAVRLEQAYDKEKIMELYLNKIPYGNTAYGIEKAAEIYFGKKAIDLDIAESAILAALPQAPSYYNPYGSNRYSELLVSAEKLKEAGIYDSSRLEKGVDYKMGLIGRSYQVDEEKYIYLPGRADLILRMMNEEGYITLEEKTEAFTKLGTIEITEHIQRISAPHFVFYVIQQLEEKYGKEVVEQGGLQVYTTIDPKLQEIAEKAVFDGVETSKAKFNATNGSLVAIDPATGQILAMVGSKDYYDDEIDGKVNIATSYRQPGSSFKPYVYAMAFYNRYAPANVVYDVRTQFGAGTPPDNYDGTFRGPVTIRWALGQSRNIPAIKAYFLAGEQKPILDLTQRMGINYLSTDRDFGWPLALGTAEITLLDHTSAFGVFAAGGKRMPANGILKITNSKGDILEQVDENKKPEEVLDPQVAYLITSILSDRSVSLGPNLWPGDLIAAVKTGTSNKKVGNINYPTNLWTVGYTTDIVVGVWTGNSDDRKSGNLYLKANGYDASAPIWKRFLLEGAAAKGWSAKEFPIPAGIQKVAVSVATGKLPGAGSEGVRTDVFASFGLPTEADTSFTTVKIDKRNNLLANDFCPKEFVQEKSFRVHQDIVTTYPNWNAGVAAWAAGMALKATEDGSVAVVAGVAPKEYSPLCSEAQLKSNRSIRITSPGNYSKVAVGRTTVTVDVTSDFPIERVAYYMDGQMQNTVQSPPYTGEIRISRFEDEGSIHTIRAVVTDINGYSAESTIEVRLEGEPTDDNPIIEGDNPATPEATVDN